MGKREMNMKVDGAYSFGNLTSLQKKTFQLDMNLHLKPTLLT